MEKIFVSFLYYFLFCWLNVTHFWWLFLSRVVILFLKLLEIGGVRGGCCKFMYITSFIFNLFLFYFPQKGIFLFRLKFIDFIEEKHVDEKYSQTLHFPHGKSMKIYFAVYRNSKNLFFLSWKIFCVLITLGGMWCIQLEMLDCILLEYYEIFGLIIRILIVWGYF